MQPLQPTKLHIQGKVRPSMELLNSFIIYKPNERTLTIVLPHTTDCQALQELKKAMCELGLIALSKTAQSIGNLHFITMVQYKIYMPALNHLH